MDDAIAADEVLIRYLIELGYQRKNIVREERLSSAKRIELVVYHQNKPFIAVEVKAGDRFPEAGDPDLLFHPYVRQLQQYAYGIHAPYYLLTNRTRHLWFVNDRTGRPSLLKDAIRPSENTALPSPGPSRTTLVQTLSNLKTRLFMEANLDVANAAALILIGKLLEEKGQPSLKAWLTSVSASEHNTAVLALLELPQVASIGRPQLADAFAILDAVQLSTSEPTSLLSAIDEVFLSLQTGRLTGAFRVSRWLSDLLVRLATLGHDTILGDISASYGDVLAAAFLLSPTHPPAATWGLSYSAESAIWAKLQQLIVGGAMQNITAANVLVAKDDVLRGRARPTHVITAPSFGMRLREPPPSWSRLGEHGIHMADELYIEAAIRLLQPAGRLVTLVPQSVLFGVGQRLLARSTLLAQARLIAVIELASGALQPYSGIGSSIIILEKAAQTESDRVYMASLPTSKVQDTFDCRELPEVKQLLDSFHSWSKTATSPSPLHAWLVPFNQLDLANILPRMYRPTTALTSTDAGDYDYPLVELGELAAIVRGASITLDPDSHVSVIGPRAIRPLILDTTQMDRTSPDRIPANAQVVEAGDIVMNNISQYLGAAALVDLDSEPIYVSRHVMLIKVNRDRVLPEYLVAAINSSFVQRQIQAKKSGAVMPGLTKDTLTHLKIPLPELLVQQRIAGFTSKTRDAFLTARAQFEDAQAQFKLVMDLPFEEGN